jgi:hypothetical protein
MKQVKGNNWLTAIMLKAIPGGWFFLARSPIRYPRLHMLEILEKILGGKK